MSTTLQQEELEPKDKTGVNQADSDTGEGSGRDMLEDDDESDESSDADDDMEDDSDEDDSDEDNSTPKTNE